MCYGLNAWGAECGQCGRCATGRTQSQPSLQELLKPLPPTNVDFSAIERRVIEALEGCGQDRQKGVDFHRLRAAEIFNVRPSEVTNLMRRVGKAANYIDAYNSKEK